MGQLEVTPPAECVSHGRSNSKSPSGLVPPSRRPQEREPGALSRRLKEIVYAARVNLVAKNAYAGASRGS